MFNKKVAQLHVTKSEPLVCASPYLCLKKLLDSSRKHTLAQKELPWALKLTAKYKSYHAQYNQCNGRCLLFCYSVLSVTVPVSCRVLDEVADEKFNSEVDFSLRPLGSRAIFITFCTVTAANNSIATWKQKNEWDHKYWKWMKKIAINTERKQWHTAFAGAIRVRV